MHSKVCMKLWAYRMCSPIYRVETWYLKVMTQTWHNCGGKLRMALKKDLAFTRKSSFALQPSLERSLRKTRFWANKAKSHIGWSFCFWQLALTIQHRRIF